jgi:hypothetical protein
MQELKREVTKSSEDAKNRPVIQIPTIKSESVKETSVLLETAVEDIKQTFALSATESEQRLTTIETNISSLKTTSSDIQSNGKTF